MKQDPYWGFKNTSIKRCRSKFSHQAEIVPGICAPLFFIRLFIIDLTNSMIFDACPGGRAV